MGHMFTILDMFFPFSLVAPFGTYPCLCSKSKSKQEAPRDNFPFMHTANQLVSVVRSILEPVAEWRCAY